MRAREQQALLTIQIEWDGEAEIWFVKESDIPGLHAEAETQDHMLEILREVIPELVQSNLKKKARPHTEVPFELIARRREMVPIGC